MCNVDGIIIGGRWDYDVEDYDDGIVLEVEEVTGIPMNNSLGFPLIYYSLLMLLIIPGIRQMHPHNLGYLLISLIIEFPSTSVYNLHHHKIP